MLCYETVITDDTRGIVNNKRKAKWFTCGYDMKLLQGHHHNGDQAARRPNVMCSICGRRFATPRFGVRGGGGWAHSVAPP